MTHDRAAAAAHAITAMLLIDSDAVEKAVLAIIRRHYAEANAGRQAAVERLVDAAESLRAEVATIVNDPDQTDLPGLEDAYCRTIEALDAVRSLPPDPQDAALTAEREALLERALALIEHLRHEAYMFGVPITEAAKGVHDGLLADAARLGITGDAK